MSQRLLTLAETFADLQESRQGGREEGRAGRKRGSETVGEREGRSDVYVSQPQRQGAPRINGNA